MDKQRVKVVTGKYKGLGGFVDYVDTDGGYPKLCVNLDSGDTIFLFLDEVTW